MEIKNSSRKEEEKLYNSIVYKIAKQLYKSVSTSRSVEFSDLISAGNEGIALGLHKYDETKSPDLKGKVSVLSYYVRFRILNFLSSESRTVRIPLTTLSKEENKITHNISFDGSELLTEAETENWIYKKISDTIGSYEIFTGSSEVEYNYEDGGDESTENNQLYQLLLGSIKSPNPQTIKYFHILCEDYGICGFKKLTRKQMMEKYGITNSAITQGIGRVLKIFQTDAKLKEILRDLFIKE